MNYQEFLVQENAPIKIADYDADFTGNYRNKEEATKDLQKSAERMRELQELMYAENIRALIVIFQAMDAAGKDSTIKHVFSGLNPQGLHSVAFKAPTADELEHDYLWRASKALPERGKIGVFSRSYYEEVIVVRVHPEILEAQQLPAITKNDPKIWQKRFEEIRNFETYLAHNGVHVLKFLINISKDEQKKQLMERINDPSKHWKFSFGDLKDRALWDEYMHAYEEAIPATSTRHAPWYIIPSNRRWFARAVIAKIVVEKLESLKMKYPEVSEKQQRELLEAKRILENEK